MIESYGWEERDFIFFERLLFKDNSLFICAFALNLDTVDNDSFGIVINRIKDTIVATLIR
jgi:hypothetical protein